MTVRLQPKTPTASGPGLYDRDVVAWALQQTGLPRVGRLADPDIRHIADEIDPRGLALLALGALSLPARTVWLGWATSVPAGRSALSWVRVGRG